MKTKLLIFGLTGDLGKRKLLPAIEKIIQTGDFDDVEIIGVSRREVDVHELLNASLGNDVLADRMSFFTMDLANFGDYHRLKERIDLRSDDQLIVYLSVPPLSATQIVDYLGEVGLNSSNVKILFEKPFGVDFQSASEVIARTKRYYKESQIYRIDHYLAKEMAQNIVAVRGSNAMFSHLWNNHAIEKIEVVAYEKIGVEGRAQFYEQTGALRDIVQGHLMQLLALTLMEIPHHFDWSELPKLRMAALARLNIANPDKSFRAQYASYQDEVGNQGSMTETFTSIELSSNQIEWYGVPLILATGKSLNEKTTEVVVHFRKYHEAQSNRLIFRIQPNEGVEIELFAKQPGYDREFKSHLLNFTFPEDTKLPDAYEQVIVDAIRSHKSLFTGGDEVLRSWEVVQPILDRWNMDNTPLPIYENGSDPASIVA